LIETNNFIIVFQNNLQLYHETDLYSQPVGRENFTVFENEVPGRNSELARCELLYILDLQIFTLSRQYFRRS